MEADGRGLKLTKVIKGSLGIREAEKGDLNT